MKRQINQKTYTDPVCGMEVSYTTAVEEIVYRGKAYYFCSTACREVFQAEPERYLSHHRQRGIKPR